MYPHWNELMRNWTQHLFYSIREIKMLAARTYHGLPVGEWRRERAREGGLVGRQPVGVHDDPAVLVLGGLEDEVVLESRPPMVVVAAVGAVRRRRVRRPADPQQVGRLAPEQLLARRRPHPAQHPPNGVGCAHPVLCSTEKPQTPSDIQIARRMHDGNGRCTYLWRSTSSSRSCRRGAARRRPPPGREWRRLCRPSCSPSLITPLLLLLEMLDCVSSKCDTLSLAAALCSAVCTRRLLLLLLRCSLLQLAMRQWLIAELHKMLIKIASTRARHAHEDKGTRQMRGGCRVLARSRSGQRSRGTGSDY